MLIDALMQEQITKALYADHDPWNTDWVNAVLTARKHYRKRRRRFFDLWLDELHHNRVQADFSGLQGVYTSTSGVWAKTMTIDT